MTELLLAGQTNDEILNSLSYKLAPTSEYIQQRRMSRFYPSGASSYSSNTTQIARMPNPPERSGRIEGEALAI